MKRGFLNRYLFLILVAPIFVSFFGTENINAQHPIIETERKFKINQKDVPQGALYKAEVQSIIQTYISFDPETRVRKINSGENEFYIKTVKTDVVGSNGLSRNETEKSMTQDQYNEIITTHKGNPYVEKIRYKFKEEKYFIELDVYGGKLEGLIIAEVEFPDEDTASTFVPPSWFGEEVTSDKKYKNSNLAKENTIEMYILNGENMHINQQY